MDTPQMTYLSGEEVHAGDRVVYKDKYGTVVFVSDGDSEEIAPGYEDYAGSERGLMICDDDGELTQLGDPDGFLTFVERG
jgi:hypothetical protein